jgi:hypothetical protein
MYTWALEIWTVKNDGSDPKIPVDAFPLIVKTKNVVRDEAGRFHGATNFRSKVKKSTRIKEENEGSRVSRRATGLRLVK